MRTRKIIIGMMMLFAAVAVNAQNVQTPSAGAGNVEAPNSDYVTIESRLPYYTPEDATVRAMVVAGTMEESVFGWEVQTSLGVQIAGVPVLDFAGAAASEYDGFRDAAAGTGLYDNEISVEWNAANGFAAGTQYIVSVYEQSVTLSSTVLGCPDLTPELKNVYVLARPTVAFDGTEGGGCAIAPGSTFYVPLDITGLGDWDVTYTVDYNGGGAGAPATYTLTLADPWAAINDGNVIAQSTLARNADGTPTAATDGLAIALPAAQYGYYDIAVTDVSDRISRKSLDPLAAAGIVGTYRIYVNPVPVTSPIQHIRNN